MANSFPTILLGNMRYWKQVVVFVAVVCSADEIIEVNRICPSQGAEESADPGRQQGGARQGIEGIT